MKIYKKKIIIISDYGREVGLGHITRAKVLESYVKSYSDDFYYFKYFFKDSVFLRKNYKVCNNLILEKFNQLINKHKFNIVILNTSKLFEKKFGKKIIFNLSKNQNIKILSIDGYLKFKQNISKILIPNVFLDDKLKKDKKIIYGWDKTLISNYKKKQSKFKQKKYKVLLVITGGTDKYNLSSNLPKIFNLHSKYNLKVNWVLGPYAKFNNQLKLIKNLNIIKNKKNLHPYIINADIVLVQFGVAFFEVLSMGRPSIVFIPKGKENSTIIKNLKKNKYNVCQNLKEATLLVNNVYNNYIWHYRLAAKFKKKFNFNENNKLIEEFLLNEN